MRGAWRRPLLTWSRPRHPPSAGAAVGSVAADPAAQLLTPLLRVLHRCSPFPARAGRIEVQRRLQRCCHADPTSAKKVSACCCTRRCSVVSSERRRVANPDTIGRTVSLLTDGLHALFTLRLWSFMVSDCATRRHCPLWYLPHGDHRAVRQLNWRPGDERA